MRCSTRACRWFAVNGLCSSARRAGLRGARGDAFGINAGIFSPSNFCSGSGKQNVAVAATTTQQQQNIDRSPLSSKPAIADNQSLMRAACRCSVLALALQAIHSDQWGMPCVVANVICSTCRARVAQQSIRSM